MLFVLGCNSRHDDDTGEIHVTSWLDWDGYVDYMFRDGTFVPKSQVVLVRKYNSVKDYRVAQHGQGFRGIAKWGFYDAIFQILSKGPGLSEDDAECTCGVADAAFGSGNVLAFENALKEKGTDECICTLSALFPLYEVTVHNYDEVIDVDDSENITPKTIKYILHPDEREHMERYLAGTDDPMYDFVHELRNNPDLIGDRRRVEACSSDRNDDGTAKKRRHIDQKEI